jgi:hypothetical protein
VLLLIGAAIGPDPPAGEELLREGRHRLAAEELARRGGSPQGGSRNDHRLDNVIRLRGCCPARGFHQVALTQLRVTDEKRAAPDALSGACRHRDRRDAGRPRAVPLGVVTDLNRSARCACVCSRRDPSTGRDRSPLPERAAQAPAGRCRRHRSASRVPRPARPADVLTVPSPRQRSRRRRRPTGFRRHTFVRNELAR